MKTNIIFIISIIILFTFFPKFSKCQCNTTMDSGATYISVLTKNEKIYRNDDLENGLQSVYANCLMIIDKADKNKVKFDFMITCVRTSTQLDIIPRQITFSLSNGQSITCSADKCDNPDFPIKGRVDRCYYRIKLSDIEMIRNNPLSSFTILDNELI